MTRPTGNSADVSLNPDIIKFAHTYRKQILSQPPLCTSTDLSNYCIKKGLIDIDNPDMELHSPGGGGDRGGAPGQGGGGGGASGGRASEPGGGRAPGPGPNPGPGVGGNRGGAVSAGGGKNKKATKRCKNKWCRSLGTLSFVLSPPFFFH